ncbi:MAG: InlB B-repeat-containing protein [Clostridia bacterium]|nr:InlB B-repeat-containing protein [Clostridia bacterium]
MSHVSFKKLCITLVAALLLLTSICILAACDKPQSADNGLTVTFHLNDGSGKTEVKSMKADETPFTPTREGYTFVGWTLDAEGNTPYESLSDNLNLYAQWNALRYTVTFFVNSQQIHTVTVLHGQAATPPTYEQYSSLLPEGDVVDGWNGGDYTHVTQSMNLYANIVKADSQAVFMDSKGESAKVVATYKGKSGSAIPCPAEPTKLGYVFFKWKTADGKDYSESSVFDGETTYYAYWSPATPVMPNVSGAKSIVYGDTLTLTASSPQNYAGITYTYAWRFNDTVKSTTRTIRLYELAAGEYTVTLILTASTDINGEATAAKNSLDISITVEKATLTASTPNVQLTFGDSLPLTFDVSYNGFKYEDNASVIKKVEVADTNYSAGSDAGRYYAVLGFTVDNYTVQDENGGEVAFDVAVQKKTVTISDSISKTYDGNRANKQFIKSEGLLKGHTLYFTAESFAANVGDYAYPTNIVIYNVSIVNENSPSRIVTANYTVNYNITAQIAPAQIQYTLPSAVKYDGQAHNAGVAVATSLCAVEYSTDGINYYETAPSFTEIGEHDVYVRISRENYVTASTKYTFVINGGQIVPPPTKPVLNIALSGDFTITYGDEMPIYTMLSYNGLIDGDSFEDVVQGTLSVACEYANNPSAGVFALHINGLSSDKYEILTENTLTVNKATLTVNVLEHKPITFGTEVCEDFKYEADGFKYDDTIAMLHDVVTIETTYTQGSPVTQDGYPVFVNLNGVELKNYNISANNSTLTVTKAKPIIETEKTVFELDYSGRVFDFMTEINPTTTNIDGVVPSLNIASGKDGGIYDITISTAESQNFLPAEKNVTVKIRAARIGRVYYTVEDALEVGGNVVLIGNAFLTHSVAIKSGTTFILPYREDGTFSSYSTLDYATVLRYINPRTENLLYTLTVKSGVTITVVGTLAIGGEIGQAGGAYQGHTTGMHSIIELESNTEIVVDENGVVDCMGGFILGEGHLLVQNGGTLKHNFVVHDFGGGTNTVGTYQKGGIAPFNIFDMPNVQVSQAIAYGATVVAYCDLYASGKHNTTAVKIVSTSGALLNLDVGAHITVKHNGACGWDTPQLTVNIYGKVSIGSIKLTVTMGITATVDMADVYCPISYIIDLHVFGTLSTSNTFKLLPGAHVTVENGGELILNSGAGLTVYTGDWKDQHQIDTSTNQPITGEIPEAVTCYPYGKGDAVLMIKGVLKVEENAAIAGVISGVNGARVNIQNGVTLTITTKEGIAGKPSGSLGGLSQIWYETAKIEKTAQLKVVGDTPVTVQAGTSYEYSNGEWTAKEI